MWMNKYSCILQGADLSEITQNFGQFCVCILKLRTEIHVKNWEKNPWKLVGNQLNLCVSGLHLEICSEKTRETEFPVNFF